MGSFPESKKYCSLTKGKMLGQGRGRWAVSKNLTCILIPNILSRKISNIKSPSFLKTTGNNLQYYPACIPSKTSVITSTNCSHNT